jgi:hypothetical protein
VRQNIKKKKLKNQWRESTGDKIKRSFLIAM